MTACKLVFLLPLMHSLCNRGSTKMVSPLLCDCPSFSCPLAKAFADLSVKSHSSSTLSTFLFLVLDILIGNPQTQAKAGRWEASSPCLHDPQGLF